MVCNRMQCKQELSMVVNWNNAENRPENAKEPNLYELLTEAILSKTKNSAIEYSQC